MSEYTSLHTLLTNGVDSDLDNVQAVELAVTTATLAGFVTGIETVEYVCGDDCGRTHKLATGRIGNLLIITGTSGEAGREGRIELFRVPDSDIDAAFVEAVDSMHAVLSITDFMVI